MGKRSDFKRNRLDKYATPEEAVIPLLSHLKKPTYFCEPCAGDGALIKILRRHGHKCVAAYDADPAHSVIKRGYAELMVLDDLNGAEMVITNPPWDRPVLHQIIERSFFLAPHWLLFDADWMHTKQAIPYMDACEKIVSVGRVKWIADSKGAGKDNCCWYLFDWRSRGKPTIFVGR